jgi:cellulose synthase/poly-beta-1,6-N-acetylglucosamine synthase-like glycosyltransferase
MTNYLAVTPARDEERLLPGLIRSLAAQKYRPTRWIIIDDGSSDSTAEIADQAAARYPWIEVHHLARNRPRAPGGESVVMRFLSGESLPHYDFILRLDADLTFDPDFMELLLAEFDRDPVLGIAGPVLYEEHQGRWHEIRVPSFHIRGAAKVYSRQCFAAIGGLEAGLGWDTVDEAHAMMLGFRTRSFPHIRAYHLRPQGAAGGAWRARLAAGRAAYLAGYSPLFMIARALRNSIAWPPFAGGMLMLAGFTEGYLRRWPRSVTPDLIRFVRRQQVRRLFLLESLWH